MWVRDARHSVRVIKLDGYYHLPRGDDLTLLRFTEHLRNAEVTPYPFLLFPSFSLSAFLSDAIFSTIIVACYF